MWCVWSFCFLSPSPPNFAGVPPVPALPPISSRMSGLTFPPVSRSKVVFNFVYNGASLQQTVSKLPFTCPWCSRDCRHIVAFVRHLRASHPRFSFNVLVSTCAAVLQAMNVVRSFVCITSWSRPSFPRCGSLHTCAIPLWPVQGTSSCTQYTVTHDMYSTEWHTTCTVQSSAG